MASGVGLGQSHTVMEGVTVFLTLAALQSLLNFCFCWQRRNY